MIITIAAAMMAGQGMADTVFDDFSGDVGARWDYVADGVMGGVSQGGAEIRGAGSGAVLRLQGAVSTDNNGGFIQVRQRFSEAWPQTAEGVSLRVKGNGETYYVFLKTPGLSRVWHSYRAPFTASEQWQTVRLPFADFSASHDGMPQSFAPSKVNSIAIVAYGADYQADVSVDRIEVY
ncbi:CIA30 family protein [Marivita sp. S6314]|uniref:CIA30 family protein n=1 Tax=Marivita sp. S6314 TaxID=2926406 RepID=UPI001FF522CF|nr:CIA30 family protein [Marivita sp. S6314]MCK0150265.1 CIA30 family protein [Marivita sp. S6314]